MPRRGLVRISCMPHDWFKREDLSEGHNHHHNIGTSCLFRVKTIALNNSTILSESDSQTDRVQKLLSDKAQ